MPRTSSLGIGLVGAGFMGSLHAAALARDPRAELRWVVDRNPAKARRVAQSYRRLRASHRRVRCAPDLESVLDDGEAAAAYVCTQPREHHPASVALLSRGLSVFVEKPLAWSVAEGRRLVQQAAAGPGTLFVGHVCRFFPEYVRIRELVQAGDVGRPAMVRASRVMGSPGGWYSDPQRSLGVPGDLLLHDFDLLLWMFGPAERTYAFSRARGGALDEQHFQAAVRLEDGTLAHLEGSWAHVDGFRTRFEVAGSEGVIEFDSARRAPLLLKQRRRGRTGSALVVPESPSFETPYEKETCHFLDVVCGEAEPRVTPAEALAALELALAAARSARDGVPVPLSTVPARKRRRRP